MTLIGRTKMLEVDFRSDGFGDQGELCSFNGGMGSHETGAQCGQVLRVLAELFAND